MNDLNTALLAAHEAGDAETLIKLYRKAAEATSDADEAAFLLTHAHVYALEIDHPDTSELREKLIAAGREVPLGPVRLPKR